MECDQLKGDFRRGSLKLDRPRRDRPKVEHHHHDQLMAARHRGRAGPSCLRTAKDRSRVNRKHKRSVLPCGSFLLLSVSNDECRQNNFNFNFNYYYYFIALSLFSDARQSLRQYWARFFHQPAD